VAESITQPTVLEQGTLLLELNHRISNEFTSAINVVSVAALHTVNDEVKAALSDVVELLHKYADVHRALKKPDRDAIVDGADYLRTLCRSVSRSKLDRRGIKLLFSSDSMWLHSERCWRLGMIVHELVTNATRHASFEGGIGEIRIDLSRNDGFVKCVVSDNGAPPANVRPGRGLTILSELTQSLGGLIEHSFVNGASTTLVFPLTQDERPARRSPPRASSMVEERISA
jgi:two-component sensor histidine kinase